MGEELLQRIRTGLDAMPPQMRSAAQFMVEHPQEVALLSMRELARRAGVAPVTVTRLARRLGYAKYEELKASQADLIRSGGWLSDRATRLATRRSAVGEAAVAGEILHALAESLVRLTEPRSITAITRAADTLDAARLIYCVGFRSSFPSAHLFSYVHDYFSPRAILVDEPGGAGFTRMRRATSEDALLVVSVEPCARQAVDATRFAARQQVPVIAITSSEISPVAQNARHVITVNTASPSFFDAITPTVAVAEVLLALLAGRRGEEAVTAIEASVEQFDAMDVYWTSPERRRPNGDARPRRA